MKNLILFQSRGHYDEHLYGDVPDDLYKKVQDLDAEHGVLSDGMNEDEMEVLLEELKPYKLNFLNVCEYC